MDGLPQRGVSRQGDDLPSRLPRGDPTLFLTSSNLRYPTNNLGDSKSSAHTRTSVATAVPPLVVPRPPLNVYLKIAIIRDSNDIVVCEDPEKPGKTRRVVVSELLDGSRTKVGDRKKNEEANDKKEVSTSKLETESGSIGSRKCRSQYTEFTLPTLVAAPTEESSASYGDFPNSGSSFSPPNKKKLEIPVPTITTVKRYALDVLPTYSIPISYVRYIRPTYEELDRTVLYNIDVEDETWWKENVDFGPNAISRIMAVKEYWEYGGAGGKKARDKKKKKKKKKKFSFQKAEDCGKKNDTKERKDFKDKGGDLEDAVEADEATNNALSSNQKFDSSSLPVSATLTMYDVLLHDPQYLHSTHSTHYLLHKFQPRLPLLVLEKMMDVLEKATGFETIILKQHAEEILVRKIPSLQEIFGPSSAKPLNDEEEGENDSSDITPTKSISNHNSKRSKSKKSRISIIDGTKHQEKDKVTVVSNTTNFDGDDKNDGTLLIRTPKPFTSKRKPCVAPPVTLYQVISQVYDYWMQKRSRLKKPLLRKFWPVTSSTDTNPHMVFRPREKAKRKLRKKRQNDLDAYKKMKQLKIDFERSRVLCDLILRREKLHSLVVDLSNDYFEQRLFEWLDTSGLTRKSRLCKIHIERILNFPKFFDDGPIVTRKGGKKRKRGSTTIAPAPTLEIDNRDLTTSVSCLAPSGSTDVVTSKSTILTGQGMVPAKAMMHLPRNIVVAGHDGGLPAPSFLQPLASRESHYVSSWEDAVPFVPSCEGGKPTPTHRFRHRPRFGRGGRIVIDRFPFPFSRENSDLLPPPTIFTYGPGTTRSNFEKTMTDNLVSNENNSRSFLSGEGAGNSVKSSKTPRARSLTNLIPKSIGDENMLSRRIEEICAMGLLEDCAGTSSSPRGPAWASGENLDEILVPFEDWMEAPDGQVYGTERFMIGPL